MRFPDSLYLPARPPRRKWLRWLGALSIVPTALVAVFLGGFAVLWLDQTGLGNLLLDSAPSRPAETSTLISAHFVPCAGPIRVTCVVDGDTFWLDGDKVRIADIDTPEVGDPQCAAERALGQAATARLVDLLNAGSFSLGRIARDQDQYGRKLRTVLRDGRSLGEVLVAEGLARRWDGARRGWC